MGFFKINDFWRKILSSEATHSSKRLVTLITAFHFILSSFIILFVTILIIFRPYSGNIDPTLVNLLKEILEYDMWIILSGLGFIGAENLAQIIIKTKRRRGGYGYFDDNYSSDEEPIDHKPI